MYIYIHINIKLVWSGHQIDIDTPHSQSSRVDPDLSESNPYIRKIQPLPSSPSWIRYCNLKNHERHYFVGLLVFCDTINLTLVNIQKTIENRHLMGTSTISMAIFNSYGDAMWCLILTFPHPFNASQPSQSSQSSPAAPICFALPNDLRPLQKAAGQSFVTPWKMIRKRWGIGVQRKLRKNFVTTKRGIEMTRFPSYLSLSNYDIQLGNTTNFNLREAINSIQVWPVQRTSSMISKTLDHFPQNLWWSPTHARKTLKIDKNWWCHSHYSHLSGHQLLHVRVYLNSLKACFFLQHRHA